MKKPFWLHALFPAHCPFCKTVLYRDEQCCADCLERLSSWRYRRPIPPMPHLKRVETLYHYQDGVRVAISLLKFHADRDAAILLGDALARMVKARLGGEALDCIIPVPLAKQKARQRGYNQSIWLAEQIRRQVDLPVLTQVLIKRKHTPDQHAQSREDRAHNLTNAFAVQNAALIADKTVLLVDDVYTSGHTCSACGKVLMEAGAKAVVVATVAKA